MKLNTIKILSLAIVFTIATNCFTFAASDVETKSTPSQNTFDTPKSSNQFVSSNVNVGDLSYSLDTSTNTAAVAGFSVDEPNKNVTIPSNIEISSVTYSVTSILDEAFKDCEIESLSIGKNVQTIGISAFSNSTLAGELIIPNSVTTINDSAFINCKIESLKIGSGLEYIGVNSFALCSNLKSIAVESTNNHFEIKNNALIYNSTDLVVYPIALENTSFTVPNGIVNICPSSFSFAFNLKNINLSDSVKNIGDMAFYFNPTIENINISNTSNLEVIKDAAFNMCTSLKSLSFPKSLSQIGDNVFDDCSSLEFINVDSLNASYKSDNGILFDSQMSSIIKYPSLNSMTSYTIPPTVKIIKERAFESTKYLSSVYIPESVSTIEDVPFAGADVLQTLTVDPNNKVFYSEDNVLYKINGSNKRDTLIQYPTGSPTSDFVIPNNVKEISSYAFFNSKNLKSLVVNESIEKLGNYVFAFCSNLKYFLFLGSNNIGFESSMFMETPISFNYGMIYCTSVYKNILMDISIREDLITEIQVPKEMPPKITGLTTVKGEDGKEINLTWDQSNTDDLMFDVYRSDNDQPYLLIDTIKTDNYLDSSTEYGHSYAYKVRAKIASQIPSNEDPDDPFQGTWIEKSAEISDPSQTKTDYSITYKSDNGSIIGVDHSPQSQLVNLQVNPNEGYGYKANSLKYQLQSSGEYKDIQNNQFTMPADNIIVTAQFDLIVTPPINDNNISDINQNSSNVKTNDIPLLGSILGISILTTCLITLKKRKNN